MCLLKPHEQKIWIISKTIYILVTLNQILRVYARFNIDAVHYRKEMYCICLPLKLYTVNELNYPASIVDLLKTRRDCERNKWRNLVRVFTVTTNMQACNLLLESCSHHTESTIILQWFCILHWSRYSFITDTNILFRIQTDSTTQLVTVPALFLNGNSIELASE